MSVPRSAIPSKNILRALVLGTLAVAAIYIAREPGVRSCPGAGWPAQQQGRGGRRAPSGIGPWAGKAISAADLHHRVGWDQRHDLHRCGSSTPWATTIGSSPGWASGARARHARRSLFIQAAVDALHLVVGFELLPAPSGGDQMHSPAWSSSRRPSSGSSPALDWRDAVHPAGPRARRRAALSASPGSRGWPSGSICPVSSCFIPASPMPSRTEVTRPSGRS